MIIAGGGAGRILIPSKKNNKYIPTVAALITTSIAQGLTPTDEMMFCVYVKGAKEVPQEALDAIKETFEAEKYAIRIGKSIDLWPANYDSHKQ